MYHSYNSTYQGIQQECTQKERTWQEVNDVKAIRVRHCSHEGCAIHFEGWKVRRQRPRNHVFGHANVQHWWLAGSLPGAFANHEWPLSMKQTAVSMVNDLHQHYGCAMPTDAKTRKFALFSDEIFANMIYSFSSLDFFKEAPVRGFREIHKSSKRWPF
jgi:hypothetical protein